MQAANKNTTATPKSNYLKVSLALLLALVISCSWLIFPYFIQGKQLLRDVGETSRVIKAGSVSRYYTRELVYHADLELTATFASSEFFQYVDNASFIRNLRPDKYFIFFVSENIHASDLPNSIPKVELAVGGKRYHPVIADGPSASEHHRISIYSFSKRAPEGKLINLEDTETIKLYVSGNWLNSQQALTFIGIWDKPFDLPEELKANSGITPIAILALGAGLLSSVLTPCLLQLVVIFGSIIGGFATVPGQKMAITEEITPVIRRKIMQTAVVFVSGFVLLYVLAGALIGAIGHQAQLIFAEYSRIIAIASGLLIIIMGFWVGLRNTTSTSCNINNHQWMKQLSHRDTVGTLLVSMAYSLGCTACFGGAIVATLIIYVGVIGSPSIGAGIMAIFSIGVAIPFLLAAYYISRMNSLLVFLIEKSRLLSLLSMVMIIGFGLILISDNFHTLSDFIYPFLGLN
jgi:cytochrome c-type biogenesis protein